MAKETSLKEIIQRIVSDSGIEVYVLVGKVKSASPIKIVAENNEKLILEEDDLIIPQHLQRHTIKASFSVGDHSFSNGTVTVNNALSAGDTVYMLSFSKGALYYVLDRTE